MRRYLLDTGIAGCYIDRRRGVFERAQAEITLGNWIGIAHPVLAELAEDESMLKVLLPAKPDEPEVITDAAAATETGQIIPMERISEMEVDNVTL